MPQYQSFPGTPGDSKTLDKLRALNLPPLRGKTFLDVGCNEGFYCGYALFDGAARSVGLDVDAEFIRRARQRFPACEFIQRGWDALPDEPFDVILLASALHYADDQPALIRRLVERLAPGGVLVLELGVHTGPGNQWMTVKRGIDVRQFPTRDKLIEVLSGFACRFMGASVRQAGDPVPREVVHVARRRPLAYLLNVDAGGGKSSLARSLFLPAGVTVVSGDAVINDVARGVLPAPAELAALIQDGFSIRRIDRTVRRIFDAGLGGDLVALWLSRAEPGRDVVFDAFVPAECRAQVADLVRSGGHVPVRVEWEHLGGGLRSPDEVDRVALAYQEALAQGTAESAEGAAAKGPSARPDAGKGIKGYVDGMSLAGDRRLLMRGWTLDGQQRRAAHMQVEVDGRQMAIEHVDGVDRPDVQAHFGLDHAAVGFELSVRLAADVAAGLTADKVSVSAASAAGDATVRLAVSRSLTLVRA